MRASFWLYVLGGRIGKHLRKDGDDQEGVVDRCDEALLIYGSQDGEVAHAETMGL